LRALVIETFAGSVAYILAFTLVILVIGPVQSALITIPGTPDTPDPSLLFLPHGVRILIAWLFKWRAVIVLLPGAAIMHFAFLGSAGFTGYALLPLFIGVTVAPLTFEMFKRLGWNLDAGAGAPRWRGVMLVGFCASIVNSLLTNYAYAASLPSYIGYLIGDFFGLFFAFLILLAVFRALERRANIDPTGGAPKEQ